jgi:GT2 family glycosyltransferase
MTSSIVEPSISVVVATTGRPENLVQLVPTVLADHAVRHLVVVVDGEDHKSVALLASLQPRFDRLVFVQIPRSGQLRALERGVRLTDADVVLLLDDDVVPNPGLAAAHARGHAWKRGLVLVGTMPVQLPAGRADIGSLLYARDYLSHCALLEAGELEVLDQLWLGNVSMRRSDCLSVGLYSGEYTASYHADQDLGFRLAAAGLVGRYDPSLAAVHRHRRTGAAFLRDARRRGAGVAHLHEVHHRLGPFDPSDFTKDLPLTVAGLISRIGSSWLATGTARALLKVSGSLGFFGWQSGRIAWAKLARRIMFVHGATVGEERPLVPAARATSEPAVARLRTPSGVPAHVDAAPETYGQLAVR